MNKTFLLILAIIAVLFVSGCVQRTNTQQILSEEEKQPAQLILEKDLGWVEVDEETGTIFKAGWGVDIPEEIIYSDRDKHYQYVVYYYLENWENVDKDSKLEIIISSSNMTETKLDTVFSGTSSLCFDDERIYKQFCSRIKQGWFTASSPYVYSTPKFNHVNFDFMPKLLSGGLDYDARYLISKMRIYLYNKSSDGWIPDDIKNELN